MRFINSVKQILAAVVVLWGLSSIVAAGQLAFVTGVSFDGQVISWNALEDATGYNIYRDSTYIATVRGSTSYTPEVDGQYAIAGFDDEGNFSPLQDSDATSSALSNNVTVIIDSPLTSTTPANINGLIYSKTAGELFWDRVLNKNYRYTVNLNDQLFDSTEGTSIFFDSLQPDTENSVTLIAFDGEEQVSAAVSIVLDTRGENFPYAAGISVDDPSSPPSAPQRPRLVNYSLTAAELFWDAPLPDQNIVVTEITRNGVLIGEAPGNSFYDDTRDPAVLYQYGLVAVNGDGVRSELATLSGNPFEGDPAVVIDRVLTGISDIVGNNPHQQYFPLLKTFTTAERPDDVQFVASTVTNELATDLFIRTEFNCNSGTFTLEDIPSRFGTFRLFFDACMSEGTLIDGELSIANSDIGGFSANYQQLTISSDEATYLVDGRVVRTISRAINFMTESYDLLQYSVSVPGEQQPERVELRQIVVDNIFDTPRSTFNTEFSVNADWTSNADLTVKTVQEFQDADLGNGFYLSGSLIAESSNGQTLTLDADTGDASRYRAQLDTPDATIGIIGNWNDTIKLPCLSVTRGDAAIPGCAGF